VTPTPDANAGGGLWDDLLVRELDPYAGTKYEILLAWLGDVAGQSVIVVGSGSGEFAALLAGRGARVLAVDIDEESVALSRQTAERFGVEVATEVSRIEDIDVARRFDLVVATDVIEHVEDDGLALAKLVALTEPGGRLLITVPALTWLFGYHDEMLGHYRRYDRRSLGRLLAGSVRIERLRYFGVLLIPAALIVSRWLRRPYPIRDVGATYEKPGSLGALLRLLFRIEKRLSPPLGTSLLMLGRPQAAAPGDLSDPPAGA
jgi:SAM-dependent methyltransferase